MRAYRACSRSRSTAPVALVALVVLVTACGGAVPAALDAPADSPSPTEPVSPTSRALAGKVVVLDPGHNGGNAAHPEVINRQVDIITRRKPCNTTGTRTHAGYREHAFTWDVAVRLKPIMEEMGARVVLTRADDQGVGPCITERAAIGNAAGADAVVSIHADGAAPHGRGFHVIMPGLVPGHNDDIIKPSRRLGLAIRNAYRSGTRLPYADYVAKDGLQARTDLGGLNLSKRPAVFLEAGNMNNRRDAAKMSDAAFRERVATSLAAGLKQYLRR
ncbi:N-acetylmuramoyl-L-alanine amidase [Nonomuraea sp. K274]|uniref:N-acetylmuramoyl-L-alanine amidase n=1 Tax=Nonomuraea cypriaca TaxID=1187855 RepID=A0A931EZS9_9ACTN|nr:N-acetylmuramoyl-L-alanine amidase [Nonomuraea cypriaca]MBF8188660.1 N-acetylmuramoyl-L-alanine amidase [Nonomuraea cypriaca]